MTIIIFAILTNPHLCLPVCQKTLVWKHLPENIGVKYVELQETKHLCSQGIKKKIMYKINKCEMFSVSAALAWIGCFVNCPLHSLTLVPRKAGCLHIWDFIFLTSPDLESCVLALADLKYFSVCVVLLTLCWVRYGVSSSHRCSRRADELWRSTQRHSSTSGYDLSCSAPRGVRSIHDLSVKWTTASLMVLHWSDLRWCLIHIHWHFSLGKER